ncbi:MULTISPECIES: hypothetical protein [Halorussus]|uniref:hypothetical protein n=1 Tax=Halorussus TaxID=1070314 RepID=UPI0013B3575F|nr:MULTISPECIES: hypothetical protein [Halorussus]NHN58580.1 hypothetical protein [Halorussus sp. JP-T4]
MAGALARLSDFLREQFLGVAIVLCLVTLLAVTRLFGLYVAVRGTYALVGLVIALLLVTLPRLFGGREQSLATLNERTARRLPKVTFILFGLAIAAAGTLDARWPLLLTVFPALYLVVGVQLVYGGQRLLAQLVALFLVTPLTKYLNTDFYFGNTDTLLHVDAVRSVVSVGHVSAIDVMNYENVPLLHVLGAMIDLVGGLSAYDAVMIAGIASFAFLLVVWFLFVEVTVGSRRLATNTTFGLIALHPFLYYSTYFIPQAMAITFWIFLLYLLLNVESFEGSVAVKFLFSSGALVLAINFTHHFTFVLMGVLLTVFFVSGLFFRRVLDVEVPLPRFKPILGTFLAGLAYLSWVEKEFLTEFFHLLTSEFVSNVLARGSGVSEGISIYALGLTVSEPTVADAVRSLFGPVGIYYALHIAVFAVALAAVLRRPDRHKRYAHLVVTGLFTAIFIFQTPLVLQGGIKRIRFPMTFFFAFVTGLGLTRLFAERTPSRVHVGLVVAVLVVLGSTASIMVADDASGVFSRDDAPPGQVQYTSQEYAQLRAAGAQVEEHGLDPATLWLTRRTLSHFDVAVDGYALEITDGVRVDRELLLYRSNWGQRRLAVRIRDRPGSGVVFVSEQWVGETVASSGKVYTSGGIGILWSESQFFGPRRRPTSAVAVKTDSVVRRVGETTNRLQRHRRLPHVAHTGGAGAAIRVRYL